MSDQVEEELSRLRREKEEAQKKADKVAHDYRDALEKHKPKKIEEIVHIVHEFGITQEELSAALKWGKVEPKADSASRQKRAGKKRAAEAKMYIDSATGAQWNGGPGVKPVEAKAYKIPGSKNPVFFKPECVNRDRPGWEELLEKCEKAWKVHLNSQK